jgi:ParB family transcriptional regulator, chromosome partitioning protein
MKWSIDTIHIGTRRREELGDLEGLADSIRQHELIHPIVVDRTGLLIAGERRLRACQQLGWTEIDVRIYDELTDDERWAIELEENLHRKDLTEYERSKTLVALGETARTLAHQEQRDPPTAGEDEEAATPPDRPEEAEGFRSTMERKSTDRGRPKEPGSYRDVAQRTGIPVATMKRAEAHVAAVEKYPELQGLTQAEALTISTHLDQLPADEREQQRAALRDKTSSVQEKSSQQGASPTGTPRRRPKDPERWWLKAIHSLWSFREKTREPEALLALARHWSRDTVQRYLQDIRQAKIQLIAWERALEAMLSPEGNGSPADARPLQPATMGKGKAASAARDGTSPPPMDNDQTTASGKATEETGLVQEPGERAGSGPQDRGHAAAQASATGKGPPASEDERRTDAPEADIDQGGSPHPCVMPPDASHERRRIALSRVKLLQAEEPKLRAIARILNAERVPTVTGQGQWDHRKVARLLQVDGVKGRNTTMKRRKKRTSAKTLRMRA